MKKNQRIKDHYNFNNNHTIPKAKKASSWSASTYSSLKKAIKFHYSVVQDDVCPYCREEIRYGGYGEPIEHIYPKSDEPNWMFEPQNLCLSCYGCNSKKHDKITTIDDFVKDNKKKYPNRSANFRIIHPHFDTYSAHIDSKYMFVRPRLNSEKGKETIRICQLNRMDLLMKRAKGNSQSRKALLDLNIEILCSSFSSDKEREEAAAFIKDFMDRAYHKKEIAVARGEGA